MQKQLNTLRQKFDSIPPGWLVEENLRIFVRKKETKRFWAALQKVLLQVIKPPPPRKL